MVDFKKLCEKVDDIHIPEMQNMLPKSCLLMVCDETGFYIKILSYQYWNFSFVDEMILQQSYLHNGVAIGKITFCIEKGPW